MVVIPAAMLASLCLCAALAPGAAAAGFCESPARSFAVSKSLPHVTPIPLGSPLPFGPKVIRLQGRNLGRYPLQPRELNLVLRTTKSKRLDWTVEVTIRRIGGSSRQAAPLFERKVDVGRLTPKAWINLGAPETGLRPGVYLRTITFYAASGRRLHSFGEYFRYMTPELAVRLTPDSPTYLRGATATICLENIGTETATYGGQREIDRFNGVEWVPSDLGAGYVALIRYSIYPGLVVPAWSFAIPDSALNGMYRVRSRNGVAFGPIAPEISPEAYFQISG